MLSLQDTCYLARVTRRLPHQDIDASPLVKRLVASGVLSSFEQLEAVLGQDVAIAVMQTDPYAAPQSAKPLEARILDIPGLPDGARPAPENLEAGRNVGHWQQRYVAWAAQTANQSPLAYHQAIGLWLLALAINRRVCVHLPWGKVFNNQYIMLLGTTTYYRKSTALRQGMSIVMDAVPHLLLPKPGSPEHFVRMLAGQMPDNFHELAPDDKTRLLSGRAFAAQRALYWDELAGLFGSTKRDFMAGLKQLLMDLYECPTLRDKEVGKYGRVVVRDAWLSIIGATTPADLLLSIGQENWNDGLLARFAIVAPEPDFQDRPGLTEPDTSTYDGLVRDLKRIYKALPIPEISEDPHAPLPPADPPRTLPFEAFKAFEAYGLALRDMTSEDGELDPRLRGFYGRLHEDALSIAITLAVSDWALFSSADTVPVVSRAHWARAWEIAEGWRESLHRVIDDLDISIEARREMSEEHKIMRVLRSYGNVGASGRDINKFAKLESGRFKAALRRLVEGGEIEAVDPPNKSYDWYILSF